RCAPAITFLTLYALLNFLRKRFFGSNFCVVVPTPKLHHIVMYEYYEVFFPLAFLLASLGQHALDVFVLIVHGLVFPTRWRNAMIETALIARGLWPVGRSKRVP